MFGIGGTRWCLPVAAVAEIVRHENVHGLPHAEAPVTGVITLHGDVVPVLDLHDRLASDGSVAAPEAQKRRRIIVVSRDGRPYGILVDEVRELVDLDEEPAGDGALPACAAGRAARGGESLPILDLVRAMDGRPA
jgi:purine-binding chemotaxis protein CheW